MTLYRLRDHSKHFVLVLKSAARIFISVVSDIDRQPRLTVIHVCISDPIKSDTKIQCHELSEASAAAAGMRGRALQM